MHGTVWSQRITWVPWAPMGPMHHPMGPGAYGLNIIGLQLSTLIHIYIYIYVYTHIIINIKIRSSEVLDIRFHILFHVGDISV